MIISNRENIVGKEIKKELGLVRGNTIRARNVARDITQALRNLVGGELKAYTELMAEAREEAIDRMEKEAEKLGADAIVNVRFMTSMVASGGAEILAYGTAVELQKK
ncbi:MAG: putative selenium binding protein beta/alpha-propeller fold [Candidatus Methanohalarchaeum thermophilum]|uniref:UPF0145 protein BTN85_1609 n=1 Tax=Methanohalarchaeum thermophilum TaxID=1903181 RepID=A0A1Q6DXM6_METT1|nr:MAG: putative selenium binding protein beta/alpha-propeller fold [Candidatus Methanohalarchaeum thermophilum]